MIKILMSSTTPIGKDGISNVMLNLFESINKEKYHIDFVTINEPEESIRNRIIDNGASYQVIKRTIKHPIKYIKAFSKACKGYDIVHVHGNSATMFLEMAGAILSGVKVRIAHSHNTYCKYKIIDRVFRVPFYFLCNVRLACGKEAGEWLFGHRQFDVVNNGIQCVKYSFNPLDRKLIQDKLALANTIVIGHVGNFLPAKNHRFILEIFNSLFNKNQSYRLLLLGDGPLFKDIKSEAEALGLSEYIRFEGSVDNVSAYLNAMDLVLMPSIYEGLPLTLIEEQANGLECIVSDTITKESDLTGNVTFIPLNQAEAFVDKIQSLKCEKTDRLNKSHESINKIKERNFDINESIHKLEFIYSVKSASKLI